MLNVTELSILILDDDEDARLRYKEILSRHFSRFLIAGDNQQARELFRANDNVSVIVTTVNELMNNSAWLMDGICNDNPKVNIVIVGSISDVPTTIDFGGKKITFIPKPVESLSLRMTVFTACHDYMKNQSTEHSCLAPHSAGIGA